MKKATIILFTIALTIFVNKAYGQKSDGISPERFLQEAELNNMNGISLCILGYERVKDNELRKYTALILNDYLKATSKLKILAKKKDFVLENSLPKHDLVIIDLVDTTFNFINDGIKRPLKNAFDKSFLQMIIEDHQSAVDFFAMGINSNDPEIKSYCAEIMPIVKKNLQEALSYVQQVLAKERAK